MKFAFLALLVVIVALFATITFAAPAVGVANNGGVQPRGVQTPRDAFNEIDANKDGVITKDEAKVFFTKVGAPAEIMDKLLQDVWSKEDTDRNGVISFEEWAAVNAPRESNRTPTDENLVATNTANTAAGVRAAGL